jgi:Putative DNA-binding domain
MSPLIPLGEAESQKLEFKGKDVLKHLPNVSREVVAMLNSGGGDIWIGLGEENGRAVRIEGLEHPDREKNRLRDHLSDAIEPSPISGDIGIEVVDGKGAGNILRVKVVPSKQRAPYTLRDGTARHFLKRVDDRLRSMSSEEIMQRFAERINADAPDRQLASARRNALEKIRSERDRNRSKDVVWLRIQPVGGNGLKLEGFADYFRDAQRTGNRSGGWNFIDPYKRIEPEGDSIRFGRQDEPVVRVFGDGAIDFTMPIINLYWKSASDWLNKTKGTEIWPYCLLEYPASVFRLAATIYRDRNLKTEIVLADLALFGIKGWTLRPHSPQSIRYRLANPKRFEEDEISLSEPLAFSSDLIIDQPDRCAFRLITFVYYQFDLWEEDMPVEFNQATGRLVLPGA